LSLATEQVGWINVDSHLLLTLLKVYHGMGYEATVPSTGTSPDASGLHLLPVGIGLIHCMVIVAAGSLAVMNQHLQGHD
jgi:hypothetical protein